MRKINLRQGLMLTAAGVMVVMLVTVLVRMGTKDVLVDKVRMDNGITQGVLTGTGKGKPIRARYTTGNERKIDWERKYPFADIEKPAENPASSQADLQSPKKNESWLMGKIKRLAAWPLGKMKSLANLSKGKSKKVAQNFNSGKKQISNWTGSWLLGYQDWVEAGRGYEDALAWHLMNPSRRVVSLDEGVWSFVNNKHDMTESAAAVAELSQWVKERGGEFLYIQAPCKVDNYGDFSVNGRLDFSNQNADELLKRLRDKNIDTLDLRENLHEWAREDGISYHDFFFKTDHHWKPETALRSAKVVAERLKNYGVPMDESHLDLDSFEVRIMSNVFLGSQGKKVTLAKTEAEDFSVLYPKFPTQFHFVIPSRDVNEVGDFTVAYNKACMADQPFYDVRSGDPYQMYSYGRSAIEYFDNLLLPASGKRVLLLRDSYANPFGPFLALGVKELSMICLYNYTGSLHSFIEEYKPDVVMVMCIAGELGSGKVDRKTHRHYFDFR